MNTARNTIKISMVLVSLILACFTTALAEDFCIKCENTSIEVLAAKKNREDRIFGGFFTEKVELERSEAADMKQKSSYVKASTATANCLGTNRLDRKIRFTTAGNLKSYNFVNAYWFDQEAYEAFGGDAQSCFDATLFASTKKGYEGQMSHRIWNRNARKHTTTVLEGNLGGRAVRVSFIIKDGERVYGLELLEQTVLHTPTTATQPEEKVPTEEVVEETTPEEETGTGTGHREPTHTEETGSGTGHRTPTGSESTSGSDNGNAQTGGDNFTGWTSQPSESGSGTGHRTPTTQNTESGSGTGHRSPTGNTGSGTGHR